MLLIQNGFLHPMTSTGPAQGDILIDHGRILRVEKRIDPSTLALERVIEADGLHVCPGLIDAHMHLVRAAECVENDRAALNQAALDAGVTTVALWSEDNLETCGVYHGGEKAALRGGHIRRLAADGMTDDDVRAAMRQAQEAGERLACEVHGGAAVRRLLAMREETGCALILAHLTDCGELAEEIASSGCPVILGACCIRGRGSSYALAHRLQALGATVALTADYPATRLHHLPLCAGLCVRAGMESENALRAITLDAARLLGVEDDCGSIEAGKRADLTIFDGDPLMLASARVMTICGGHVVKKS